MNKLSTVSLLTLLLLLYCFLPSVELLSLKDGTQSSKFFVFTIGISLSAILYSLSLIYKRTFKIAIPDIFLFALFIYIVTERFLGRQIESFSLRFYELLALAALYMILRSQPLKNYIFLIIAVIVGCILQAVYGNLQLYGFMRSNHDLFNITGSFFNPGPYAGYLAGAYPAALGLYLYSDVLINENLQFGQNQSAFWGSDHGFKIIKYIALAGVIAILLILPATQSRASWMAVIISTAFLVIKRYDVKTRFAILINRKNKFLITAAILITLIVGGLGIFKLKEESSKGRLLVWKVALEMIGKQPLNGFGFDRFQAHYMTFQAEYFRLNPNDKDAQLADNVDYVFNEFIQFLVENGIAASAVLIILIIYLTKIKNNENKLQIIAVAGLLSSLAFAMFSYPSQILPIKLNGVLYLAIIASSYQEVVSISIKKGQVLFYKVSILCLLILTTTVFFKTASFVKQTYQAFKNWNIAYDLYLGQNYIASLNYYNEAYQVLDTDGLFLMQYGKALSMAGENQKAIKILNTSECFYTSTITEVAKGDSYKALKNAKLAERAYSSALFMAPGRFYPSYLLAQLYLETNQNEKAIEIAKEILAKKVKVPSPATDQIMTEMKQILKYIK